MKPLWYYKLQFLELLRHWLFWSLTGFPFKKRCPQCAGSGRYATESMARHPNSFDIECPMCTGKGLVHRNKTTRNY